MENRVSYNTFYASWHEAMKELTLEQYGRLSMAINEYCFTGVMPELTGIEKALFIAFKPNIDSSVKTKIDGKKGGAPSGNRNAQKTTLVLKNNPPCENETTPLVSKKQPLFLKNNPPCENETTYGDGEGEEEEDVYGDGEPENNLSKYFLSLWQKHGDVFNIFSRIEDFEAWERYWKRCNFSPQYIETAVKNVVRAFHTGVIEPQFIPATPDRFVLKGWLQRWQTDLLPPEEKKALEQKIASQAGAEAVDRVCAEVEQSKNNIPTDLPPLVDVLERQREEREAKNGHVN
jgi:hypothetical protein